MRHLILCALVLLAGCAASQRPTQPQPQYVLPVDADWVKLSPQVDIRRKGFGDPNDLRSRHYWVRIWDLKEGTVSINEDLAECPSRQTMPLAVVVYDMKTDKIVKSFNSPIKYWTPVAASSVIPDSVGELAFDFACQPPEVLR